MTSSSDEPSLGEDMPEAPATTEQAADNPIAERALGNRVVGGPFRRCLL